MLRGRLSSTQFFMGLAFLGLIIIVLYYFQITQRAQGAILNFHPNTDRLNQRFRLSGYYKGKYYSGKYFNQSFNRYLDEFGLIDVEETDSARDLYLTDPKKIVFVTAFSNNHFPEALQNMRTMRNMNYSRVLYIYDLGLTEDSRQILLTEWKDLLIELRKFPWSKYPDYVGTKLRSFRWKPLIVAEILKVHSAMFWIDSSTAALKPIDLSPLECSTFMNTHNCKFYPWMLWVHSYHSIFAGTQGNMYNYLPMPEEKSTMMEMWGANQQLIFGTKRVKENVLRLWVLCALEEDCLDYPDTIDQCDFTGTNWWTAWAWCHRHDQSAINILLAWENDFDNTRFVHNFEIFDAIRTFYDPTLTWHKR
eukprot:TRINITY_DN10982_c0_g1_i1.p1 TRINITY_DN10982_c0_g1~~TRINITY_DN10982_c0_g1_i1.p1  ORF type:complete len:363 (-),score=45.62 TRINITY_DN10982_c0_g1_i1:218-1306(-)